jgi:hypothetical protein
MRSRVLLSVVVLAGLVLACAGGLRIRPAEAASSQSKVKIGFRIAPVPLDLRHKNRDLVGLGSYIVNAQGGCNDCHTNPPYAEGGNPFLGEPEHINTAHYLAGGMAFGPDVTSANITPDKNGLPGGATFQVFLSYLRTGHDPDDPKELLQVMPWPVYGKMNDHDLRAIYEYLRSIPHAEPASDN